MLFDLKKNTTALILDIGNGSIGGALALFTDKEQPRVMFSIRDVFSFEEKPTGEKLEQAVFQSLETIISTITRKGFDDSYFKNHSKKIDHVLCVLSSPWFISQGKTIVLSQDKKFVISERFLQDILTKEYNEFEKSIKDQSDALLPKRIIEKNILSIKANGYMLKNPIGQKVQNFETSLYMSLADDGFVRRITDSILGHLHIDVEKIVFKTFPSVTFSTISDLFVGTLDYLHFDVAGEITDITLVRGGLVKKTVSYPTGTNLLVRRIAQKLSVPNQVARSFFHLFMDGRADSDVRKHIQESLTESEAEWNVYLNDALLSLAGGLKNTEKAQEDTSDDFIIGSHVSAVDSVPIIDLPKKIFVTAYPRTFELFNQFLNTEKTDETGEWRKGITVTYMGEELLSHFVGTNKLQPFDSFLHIEALFFSKYFK